MSTKGKKDESVNSDSVLDRISRVLDANGDPSDNFTLEDGQTAIESQNTINAQAEARARKSRILKQNEESEFERKKIYKVKDIIERAKALSLLGQNAIKYIHFIKSKQNKDHPIEISVRPNPASELNLMAVLDALYDYGSGSVPFPHQDTFGQRLVDEFGEPLTNKNIRIRDLMTAINICGMDNPRSINVLAALKTWAVDHESDFLQDHFEKTIPKWDGITRLETELIKIFGSDDTKLNKEFGRYFWLSLYNRIMKPGSFAPLSLALIGAQRSGKSYFCVLLCKYLMGDEKYKPVQLDLSVNNYNNFLRDITGKSIVANVGEQIGLKSGDLKRIKEFVPKAADDLNFKFENSITKARQWIVVMDGNSYEGLQRDETGNRRFYPMFVGQLPDKDGQPDWKKEFKADFSTFEQDLWQIMAECRAWMEEHSRVDYVKVVDDISLNVMQFSEKEQSSLRGIIKDRFIEDNLLDILLHCNFRKVGKNSKEQGWFTSTFEILQQFLNRKKKEPFSKTLKMYMEGYGFVTKQIAYRGYFLTRDLSERDFKLYLLRGGKPEKQFSSDELKEFELECDRLISKNSGSF